MNDNRVIEIEGPADLPAAAMELLQDKTKNMVHVRGFYDEDRHHRLMLVSRGYRSGDLRAPSLSEYGEEQEAAMQETFDRARAWLGEIGVKGLTYWGQKFMGDRGRQGGIAPHIDPPGFKGRVAGPLTASIALKGSALWFATRGESVLREDGTYDRRLHSRQERIKRRLYFLRHFEDYSCVVQQPRDLVMIMNAPVPSPHKVSAWATREAVLYDMCFYAPERNHAIQPTRAMQDVLFMEQP